MPRGQSRGYEKAEPVTPGQVELRRIREIAINISEWLIGDAKAAVLDLNSESLADGIAENPDGRIRGREDSGILCEFCD
jgi:hypothetical protein